VFSLKSLTALLMSTGESSTLTAFVSAPRAMAQAASKNATVRQAESLSICNFVPSPVIGWITDHHSFYHSAVPLS
jgi:hypothetical protein